MKWRVLFCTLVVSFGLGFAADKDTSNHSKLTPEEKQRVEAETAKKNELVKQRNKCLEDRAKVKENSGDNRFATLNSNAPGGKPATNLDGAALYAANCLVCHATGEGKQGPIKDMSLAHTRTGVDKKTMPPKAAPSQPTDEERKAIQAHLLTLTSSVAAR